MAYIGIGISGVVCIRLAATLRDIQARVTELEKRLSGSPEQDNQAMRPDGGCAAAGDRPNRWMDGEHPTIYVYLENEGVDVWRPVLAEHLETDVYRIVSEAKEPEHEQWQFKTGEVVRCEPRVLSDGDVSMVAVERVSATI